MNQKINNQLMLVLSVSLALSACNSGDKKEEPKSTDSTKTETVVQPTAPDASMEAATVAPALYKVLNDSLGIRISEATYKPGDSSAMHHHPDYALYVIEGGTAQFIGKDGTKADNEMKTGMENIRPGEFHSVKNVGKTTVKALLVEVNRPAQTMTPDAAMDATKVAPKEYKAKNDTLGIRIVEASYKPGESSVLHSHPDCAVYVISGGTAQFTAKDGTKMTNEMKTGMTMISPADTHSVKNVGKTTMKVLLVEVNRARN